MGWGELKVLQDRPAATTVHRLKLDPRDFHTIALGYRQTLQLLLRSKFNRCFNFGNRRIQSFDCFLFVPAEFRFRFL
jgi:hypothetical protein